MADSAVALSTRLQSATSLALIGATTLCAALALHELLSFGPGGYDVIARAGSPDCRAAPCVSPQMVIFGQIAKAVGAALVFALVGAFTVSLRGRLGVGAALWVAQYFWSMLGIASGYRAQFGTTWAWWEPFAELMWRPGMSLPLMLGGLAIFCVAAARTTAARATVLA